MGKNRISFVRIAFNLMMSATVFFSQAAHAQDQTSPSDWIYFDLGDVIVTGNPTAGYTYVPGAMDYLKDMRHRGYKLALISNTPESWGSKCSDKVAQLKKFLGSRLHESVPMDWTLFDKIVLAPFDRYRKPHGYTFMRGLEAACPGRSMYIGEDPTEIGAAKALGFATFTSDFRDPAIGAFPAPTLVPSILDQEFSFKAPAQCNFNSIIDELLHPEDRGHPIQGCVELP